MVRHLAEALLRRLPVVCGGLVVAVGMAALSRTAAAALHLSALMAVCFVLLGAALAALGAKHPPLRLAGRVLATAVLALGLFGCLECWLLWRGASGGEPATPVLGFPGFMPLGAALAFVFGSLSLLTLAKPTLRVALSVWLAIGVAGISSITLLAFLFGSPSSFGPDEQIRMSLLPAVVHLLLAAGLLALHHEDFFMRVLMARTVVGLFVRRMILLVLLLPAALGLLRMYLFSYDELGGRAGLPVFLVIYMLAGVFVTLWAARITSGLEQQRAQAEEEQRRLLGRLQEQAAGLQEQVAVRTGELEEANAHLRAAGRLNTRLSLVASHTTSGVVITDAGGDIEWVNKAWEHMAGYPLDEVLGRSTGDLLRGPGTNPATAQRLQEAIRRGLSCYEEILCHAKDGRPYWIILDLEPVRNEAGEIANFISVQTDITQFRESQQQLQGLTDRLQLTLHFSGFGVWEMDVASGHMTWDARMHEIYGCPREPGGNMRERWRQCVHPEDLPLCEQKFAELIAGRAQSFDVEFRIRRASDGADRYLEAQGYLQRDENGGPLRLIGLNRDITVEHHQRDLLHASTERLRLALRASGHGVWDVDMVAGVSFWDSRQCEIYGVEPEKVNGASKDVWIDLIHPDDREKILANLRAATESADEFYNEYRIVRPDGAVRHIEAHGHLRRDAAGKLIRATGMDRDVTAEKEMQEALRLAEERWQLAVAATNEGVWDWNVVSDHFYFDPRYAEILEYAPDGLDPHDRTLMGLIHPDDLGEAMAARESHLAGETTFYRAEYRMRTKSGDWKWVLGRGKVVARDAAGRALRMVGTLSDISKRQQLEQSLRRNQELADHVERMAMIGGWEFDLRDNTLYWSSSVRRLHEVPDDYQPRIETALDFFTPESRPVLQTAFNRCLADGEPYDLELPLITATGRRILVRTLGRDEVVDGRRVRLYGAFQDVTARHEAEEARRQLETQLFQSQKMETLGTLAGGIAHDFNNLLTGIMGYQDLAVDVLPPDHQIRGYLKEAQQASLRARELVEQILTFSRQQESPEFFPVDLALLVAEARRFLRAMLPSTIQIQAEVEPDCPRVLADSTQLHQVLLNLGSNGAQAMGARGGMLKFALRQVELDDARAAATGGLPSGRYVCLSVSDWGHGIDEATLKRIFDPFFTTKKPGEGTGLGLSVVHGIVRNHKGGIEVESTLGVGTTFHIYLPVAVSDTEPARRMESSPPHGNGDSVFLVDDEGVVTKFTAIALERLGYKVVTFDSALPCLEAISANPQVCDVLVTDQTMPGLTGTDLIEAVHKINPALPVVLMSGYFTKISGRTLDRLSHVELLNKPFTTEELAMAVQRALAVAVE